jgi:hypothetical protein
VIIYGQKKKEKESATEYSSDAFFGAILHQFARKKTLMFTRQRISHVVII